MNRGNSAWKITAVGKTQPDTLGDIPRVSNAWLDS